MCKCTDLIKAIDAYIAKADEDLKNSLGDAGFADPEGTAEEIKTLEEQVAEALLKETDYLLSKLNDSVDLLEFFRDMWPDIKFGDTIAQDLFEIFFEEFTSYMVPLASTYIAQTDGELVVEAVSKRTSDWITSWSEELANLMKLDSHTIIENILLQGLEEGQGVQDVTQAIMDSGIRDEYFRARRAAVTEVLRAHSVASQEAMMQSPAVEEKEWKHTGSYRNVPRQNHVDMNGQRVPKGDTYTLIGADGRTHHPAYPRDPVLPAGESVNCKCISQAIVSEKVLGLSIEERRKLQAEAIAEMDEEWEAEQERKFRESAESNDDDLPKATKTNIIKLKNSELKNGLSIKGEPDSIVDKIDDSGNVLQRRLYDADGMAAVDYDTNDHGLPKAHPTGAHKHIFDHSKKNPRGRWNPLTDDDLDANSDIIQRGVNYHD